MSQTFESPFLDKELFVREASPAWEPRADALVAASPFLDELQMDGQVDDGELFAAETLDTESYEFVDESAMLDRESPDNESFNTPQEEAELHASCSESGHGIIGSDDRRKVANPLEVPCRWICHLWTRREDSDGKVTHSGGTGVLISPRHVLTVAHLVSSAKRNDRGRWITTRAVDIRVTPARDGDDRPFDAHDVKMPARVSRGWSPIGQAAAFDYALLTLDKPIGKEVFNRIGDKRLCYWGSRTGGQGTTLRATIASQLQGRTVITAGYPKDKGGKIPYIVTGQLSNVRDPSPTMDISADACQGQSGSPVWANVGDKHCMVGMMVRVGETTNTALRFTDAFCTELRSWLNGESDVCTSRAAPSKELEHSDDIQMHEHEHELDTESDVAEEFESDSPESEYELLVDNAQLGDDELEAEWDSEIDTEAEEEAESAWANESRMLDPTVLAIAERVVQDREFEEQERRRTTKRWTRCFTAADTARVRKAYQDNAAAAAAHGGNRCSCIVMLNVALGELLQLKQKEVRARGTSDRRVKMAALTTETIEKAMAQLERSGFAAAPIVMNFFDKRGKTAGTLKPVKLKASVQARVLKESAKSGCWYAYALSVMDGYHSVLLLVDYTGASATIYWLDQFASDIDDDVTTTLDARLTTKTQDFWQSVMDEKGKGYDTMIRLWPLKVKK